MTLEELHEKKKQLDNMLEAIRRDMAYYEGQIALLDELMAQLSQEQFIAQLEEEWDRGVNLAEHLDNKETN